MMPPHRARIKLLLVFTAFLTFVKAGVVPTTHAPFDRNPDYSFNPWLQNRKYSYIDKPSNVGWSFGSYFNMKQRETAELEPQPILVFEGTLKIFPGARGEDLVKYFDELLQQLTGVDEI